MFEDRLLNVLPFAILLLPLGGFVVLALFGDWIKKDKEENGAGYLACATVIAAFGLAAWTTARLYGLVAGPEGLRFSQPYLGFEWIEAGGFRVPLSLLVDPLSSVMMLVVTGVGSLIHVYSLGYMAHDEDRVRFFSYLNLFTFFMLLLVLGGSLPVLFVGWEGVGLCSYLLIGFWYRKDSASAAGLKAFVVNRVGDAGLILGMVFIYHAFGSLDLVDIADNAGSLAPERLWEWGPATIACLLLFVGATGKSAQIPLHVWLPDAMEGPTPVSALIHAATMVTAGVYMVARLGPLYHVSETAMLVVAVDRRRDRAHGGDDRDRPDRHQAGARLLHGQPARLHVPRRRGGGVRGGRLPPLHPRLLQGAPLPRLRLRHPRDVGRAGHAEDGRAAEEDPLDLLDLPRGHARDRRHPALRRLLQQGRDPPRGARARGTRSSSASPSSPRSSPPPTWRASSS